MSGSNQAAAAMRKMIFAAQDVKPDVAGSVFGQFGFKNAADVPPEKILEVAQVMRKACGIDTPIMFGGANEAQGKAEFWNAMADRIYGTKGKADDEVSARPALDQPVKLGTDAEFLDDLNRKMQRQ